MYVVVVDDENAVREILARAIADAGHTVEQAATQRQALEILRREDVDLALCDIKLPDGDGLDILKVCVADKMRTQFIMMTAFASVDTAVEALRSGAADFITKPVRREELLHRIEQIRLLAGLRDENLQLRRRMWTSAARRFRFESPAMRDIERLATRVAGTDSTVLITGESGTGKGILARQLHEMSSRAGAAFVSINCSAIPEQLLESELFGHSRGAFTSADHAHKGLFLQADGGTLFLDEIGELPLSMQSKLLHAIEEKEFRPLGSERARRADVRILAATNRALVDMSREGRFREDLYFRLAMFEIRLPPLRELRGDIPGLIRFLLDAPRNVSGSQDRIDIDPLAEEVLVNYGWPGNIRELENVLRRARILAEDSTIRLADIPSELADAAAGLPSRTGQPSAVQGVPLREQVRQFELHVLHEAIDEAGGDRRIAADRLGIALSTLYRKLEEAGN